METHIQSGDQSPTNNEACKELDAADDTINGAHRELDVADDTINGARRELDVADDTINGAHRELDVADVTINGARRELDVADVTINGARRELDVADVTSNGARREFDVCDDSLEQYRGLYTVPNQSIFEECLMRGGNLDTKMSSRGYSNSKMRSRGISGSKLGSSSKSERDVEEIGELWAEIGELKRKNKETRKICDDLRVVKDGNNSAQTPQSNDLDQRKSMRDIYVELRNAYPSYLTLLTILFTLTIRKSEIWLCLVFMVLCEFLFVQMGMDALRRIKEISKKTVGVVAGNRKSFFARFSQRRATERDTESQPLVIDESDSTNVSILEERNLWWVIAFAVIYTLLLTIYLVFF